MRGNKKQGKSRGKDLNPRLGDGNGKLTFRPIPTLSWDPTLLWASSEAIKFVGNAFSALLLLSLAVKSPLEAVKNKIWRLTSFWWQTNDGRGFEAPPAKRLFTAEQVLTAAGQSSGTGPKFRFPRSPPCFDGSPGSPWTVWKQWASRWQLHFAFLQHKKKNYFLT